MLPRTHEILRVEECLPARWGADVETIASVLFAQVRERCGGRTPSVISIRLGERVRFSDDDLVRSLRRISRGTSLANAMLRIERIPSRWFCPGCDGNLKTARCRRCDLSGILEAGEEMVLDAIETE